MDEHKDDLGDDSSYSKGRRGATEDLFGKTVLVTRSRVQAAAITELLESRGARVIHCPTIHIVEPDDWAPADRSITALDAYDYVIFTSTNGVRYFMSRLERNRPDGWPASKGPCVCAIGPATAHSLQAAGVAVDLVARDSSSEGILAAVIDRAGGTLSGRRFLIPRAKISSDLLPTELSRLSAHVDAVEVYQTIRPDTDMNPVLQMLRERAIDAVTFLSPSAVTNFAALIDQPDLSLLLKYTVVACIGNVTAARARKHGLVESVTADTATADALVELLVQTLK